MAIARLPAADLVTLGTLHAALDGIVEIEALIAEIHVAPNGLARVSTLATELRELLVGLLRVAPA